MPLKKGSGRSADEVAADRQAIAASPEMGTVLAERYGVSGATISRARKSTVVS